jgi:hypothetical protein
LVVTSLVDVSVGYDDRKMMLGGQFDYEEDNQRALPFNVRITEISEEMKVHRGSTSKLFSSFKSHLQKA